MIIETNNGLRLDCREAPQWSEYWKEYYVTARRWIRSKKAWVKAPAQYNFTSYREVGA